MFAYYKSAFSQLGAIFPDDCLLDELTKDVKEFKFLFIICDSAPTNRAIIRGWTAALSRKKRLLVIHGPCWQHILSNCTALVDILGSRFWVQAGIN